MERKIYITPYKAFQMMAVYEDEQLVELYADKEAEEAILDRIFVGKVMNVVKNIRAAFIETGGGRMGYYSLEENKHHIFLNPKKNDKLVPGDELLVQVARENVKTKAPVLTSAISFTGRYVVLKLFMPLAAVSSKISDKAERERLKGFIHPFVTKEYGFIVRTKAAGVPEEALQAEIESLIEKYKAVMHKAKYMKCFSEVYREPPEYIRRLNRFADNQLIKISTDIRSVYDALTAACDAPAVKAAVFYEDDRMPLIKLLSLETQIERALNPRVWLKSGGFLVIEQTEALVAIDVNTGRYAGNKKGEEAFFMTNMEAAAEIARQIRLRNLSGIILIDFIDMKEEAHKKSLIAGLKEALKKDTVKTVVVDMTRLNLVEMTRKKERRPLHEQMGVQCPTCSGRGLLF